jgi:putative FmdB family regulatory protein
MGVFDKLRETFGGEGRTYSYQCLGCRTTFESQAGSAEEANCPDCGAEDVRGVVTTSGDFE